MKWCILSLSILLFASCSRFSAPHYRKIKLVPAHENSFSVNSDTNRESILTSPCIALDVGHDSALAVSNSRQVTSESSETVVAKVVVHNDVVNESEIKSHVSTSTAKTLEQPIPIRRDWSVLIAVLLLIGGICLLLWSVVIFFALPAAFWIRLLIGVGMVPLAIRMILLGTRIIFNRWRNPVNYKESGH